VSHPIHGNAHEPNENDGRDTGHLRPAPEVAIPGEVNERPEKKTHQDEEESDDVIEGTGIYRSLVGGHNHMVDHLHFVANGDIVEYCFCNVSGP
jgi:hypothetical protein